PGLPFIGGFEEHIGGRVQRGGIVRRKENREVPLETILEVAGAMADGAVGPDVDAADLAGLVIDPHQETGVGAAVDDVRVFRVCRDVAALAASGRLPVAIVDAEAIAAMGNPYR